MSPQANIARVQELVACYQNENAAGYLAGVAEGDSFKGSILGGLIPGGEAIKSKAEFVELMGRMGDYMEVKKFEPGNWFAVNNDVLFTVDWEFMWKPTGKVVETTALVRKVLDKDNNICEKYHMVDTEAITGQKSPHDESTVKRVQSLLAEIAAGNPAGYMAGVADNIQASMLGGLIKGADGIANKQEFQDVMSKMNDVMEVKKFEPCNFRALPNNDMMFTVNWELVWKATGKTVTTTAVVRKVLDKDNNICAKYHMIDATAVTQESPRDVTVEQPC